MLWSLGNLILLTLLAAPNSTLTPEETCALCQTALRTVFGHFGANIPSRRKLVHQLKHECKRHFNYRRRCLLLMKQHYNMVFLEMTDGSFTPMQACLNMKGPSLELWYYLNGSGQDSLYSVSSDVSNWMRVSVLFLTIRAVE
uniref:CRE-TWK-44 protein n=1 Tax=Haemonchus contortus TaxID=6289 RepID=W6NAE6_HAECO